MHPFVPASFRRRDLRHVAVGSSLTPRVLGATLLMCVATAPGAYAATSGDVPDDAQHLDTHDDAHRLETPDDAAHLDAHDTEATVDSPAPSTTERTPEAPTNAPRPHTDEPGAAPTTGEPTTDGDRTGSTDSPTHTAGVTHTPPRAESDASIRSVVRAPQGRADATADTPVEDLAPDAAGAAPANAPDTADSLEYENRRPTDVAVKDTQRRLDAAAGAARQRHTAAVAARPDTAPSRTPDTAPSRTPATRPEDMTQRARAESREPLTTTSQGTVRRGRELPPRPSTIRTATDTAVTPDTTDTPVTTDTGDTGERWVRADPSTVLDDLLGPQGHHPPTTPYTTAPSPVFDADPAGRLPAGPRAPRPDEATEATLALAARELEHALEALAADTAHRPADPGEAAQPADRPHRTEIREHGTFRGERTARDGAFHRADARVDTPRSRSSSARPGGDIPGARVERAGADDAPAHSDGRGARTGRAWTDHHDTAPARPFGDVAHEAERDRRQETRRGEAGREPFGDVAHEAERDREGTPAPVETSTPHPSTPRPGSTGRPDRHPGRDRTTNMPRPAERTPSTPTDAPDREPAPTRTTAPTETPRPQQPHPTPLPPVSTAPFPEGSATATTPERSPATGSPATRVVAGPGHAAPAHPTILPAPAGAAARTMSPYDDDVAPREHVAWVSGAHLVSAEDSRPSRLRAAQARRGHALGVVVAPSPAQSLADLTRPRAVPPGLAQAPGQKVLTVPLLPGGATPAACAKGAYRDSWATFGRQLTAAGLSTALVDLQAPAVTDRVAAATYTTCYRDVARAVRGAAPGVRFQWTVDAGPAAPGGLDPLLLWPGRDVVDVVAVRALDQGSWAATVNGPYGLNWWADFAHRQGRAIAVAEWGTMPGSDVSAANAPYVYNMRDWIVRTAAKGGFAYEAHRDTTDDGAATRAYLRLFGA